ncbi:hypothetical protein [Georgenia sp. AZ-5]|uniref:hypothetical protein n=1 Tax=Georgenia sp. AZ-5 TaxID=3367526 RepID=UPI0037546422
MGDYSLIGWQNEPSNRTPISDANLNKMDVGIKAAHDELNQVPAKVAESLGKPGSPAAAILFGTGGNVRAYPTAADAHTENTVVYYPPGDAGAAGNIYGINYTSAIGPRWQAGAPGSPTTDAKPVMWVQKYSRANRPGEMANEWDQGLYAAITKESGGAYTAGITGYVRNQGGTGQSIGIHGRASGYTADSDVFGMWAYAAAANPNIVPRSIIGTEIDMNNMAPDQGWEASVGASRGLVVVGADGSNPLTRGIEIGANGASPNGKFWTGLLLRKNGTMPSGPNSATQVNNGEAVRFDGATAAADSYNAIRFMGGHFSTGISFTESSFGNNAAILMGDNQRIVVGPGPASSTYLSFNKTTSVANFNNMAVQVNGTQVLTGRRSGWGVNAGTATRTAFDTATVTLPQLAERVKALIDDLRTHGLIGA